MIKITAGDTRVLPLTITREGEADDLTGAELWFIAKGPTTTIEKGTTAGGIEVTDPAGGLAEVTLGPDDTADVVAMETLSVEVQLKTADGAIETIVRGVELKVLPQLITAS